MVYTNLAFSAIYIPDNIRYIMLLKQMGGFEVDRCQASTHMYHRHVIQLTKPASSGLETSLKAEDSFHRHIIQLGG